MIWPKVSGETEKPCSRGLIRFRLTFFSKTTTEVLSASFRLLVMQGAIDNQSLQARIHEGLLYGNILVMPFLPNLLAGRIL